MRRTKLFASFFLASILAAASWAADIRIIAPYAGTLTNAVDVDKIGEVKDTGLLTGLYFQWIKPEVYQWNAFAYYAPDVNYSTVVGGHFIFDYYFGPDWNGKFLAGAGLEALRVDMDAGADLGIPAFAMETTVLVPYLRTGKYFATRIGAAALSLMPWAGIQPQWVWGDITAKFSKYSPEAVLSVDDYAFFGIAGVNLKATLFRFIDLEGKYQATFNGSDYYSTYNATANLFLTRNWGLSYRFKQMENSQGKDGYHYFGVAYVF